MNLFDLMRDETEVRQKMTLRPYQEKANKKVIEGFEKGIKTQLVVMPTGCHAAGEKILLANGEARSVEDLQVGDRLIGPDNTYPEIVKLVRGHGKMYKITPVKGEPLIVNEDHILSLKRTNDGSKHAGSIVDVSVKEWLGWNRTNKHIHKLVRFPADFMAGKNTLPMRPYLLGLFIGDGCLTLGMPKISKPDIEIRDYCEKVALQDFGIKINVIEAGRCPEINFSSGIGRSKNPMRKVLEDLGLWGRKSGEKFVPSEYKVASTEDRLEMLAGLIDTDGHNTCGGVVDWISKSWQLAEDFAFLARSLGFAAYIKKCRKGCNGKMWDYYRVSLSGDLIRIPTKIPRKIFSRRLQVKDVLVTGFKAEEIGNGDYYGFTLSPESNGRFLMGDFTLTHNCGKTISFAYLSDYMHPRKTLVLCDREELINQARDKIIKATGLYPEIEKAQHKADLNATVVVGSVQTMRGRKRFPKDHFGMIICDEAHLSMAASWQNVLKYYEHANVVGFTATPEASGKKNLGDYYEHEAFRMTLREALIEAWLTPIHWQTLPLEIKMGVLDIDKGDFDKSQVDSALRPYLERIADLIKEYAGNLKTLIFLPLICTSVDFCDMLRRRGLKAGHIDGEQGDRPAVLGEFANRNITHLCNSLLLTTGFDDPSIECIVNLRPTRSWTLAMQIVGRGTRTLDGVLQPGMNLLERRKAIADSAKPRVLVLDFLYHTEKHSILRTPQLVCEDKELSAEIELIMRESTGGGKRATTEVDIMKIATEAREKREQSLAKQLAANRKKEAKMADALDMAIAMGSSKVRQKELFDKTPVTDAQKQFLNKHGIKTDALTSSGQAELLIKRIKHRMASGMSSPKQIQFFIKYGSNPRNRHIYGVERPDLLSMKEAARRMGLQIQEWKDKRSAR